MGRMSVLYRILPDSPGKDAIDQIVDKLSLLSKDLGLDLKDYKIEPFAYGLYELKVLFIVDEEGGVDRLEEMLKSLEGVASIENIGMNRL